MKLIKPNMSLMAILLAGSLCTLPAAYAAGVGVGVGAGVNSGAGSVGAGTSTDVNGATTGTTGTGTTGTGATGSGTINDPTIVPSNPTDTTPERMDRNTNRNRPNATITSPNGNRGTNMRNKDCDVNVSSNDPTMNCNDTNKPRK